MTAIYAIEHPGPQEHTYTLDEFITRYEANFGKSDEVDSLRATAASRA